MEMNQKLEAFPQYQKIQSLYKRTLKGRIIEGEWAIPEIEFLKDNTWQWTEKVDGTNCRFGYLDVDRKGTDSYSDWTKGLLPFRGNEEKFLGGRTDKAEWNPAVKETLVEIMKKTPFEEVFNGHDAVTLYGECYGAGIQKGGGNYISDGVDFVLFEVRIGYWWLDREAVVGIANQLDLNVVPLVLEGTIQEAIDLVKGGYESAWGEKVRPEGVVGKPLVELRNRKSERILTKIKGRDFD